jgi:DNA-binding winged helix-turn-helix (wHTH) protein/tetratricopeptide (TPR) repeat protein
MSTREPVPPTPAGAGQQAALRVECPAGTVYVNPDTREVWQDGQLVLLAPQVFDCIAYLLANRARAVGRDELIAAVWGRTDVSDAIVHLAIMKARRVFGDSGTDQQVLRTVPRFGYRWIASVDEASAGREAGAMQADMPGADDSARTDGDAVPASSSPLRRRRRYRIGAVVLAFGIVVAAAAAWWAHEPPTVPQPASTFDDARGLRSGAIVVLPVEVAASADTAWIPLGVMDAIGGYLRDGGEAIVPSQTVIGLLHDSGGDETVDAGRWSEATGAGRLVRAAAVQLAEGWRITLVLHDAEGARHQALGEAPEVLDAAREASENLLGYLQGGVARKPLQTDANAAVARLLQQARADVLANRLDAAQALLDAAPAALRAETRVRMQRADVDFRTGKLDAAKDAYQDLLAELPAESQPVLRARVLMALGSIDRSRGTHEAAERRYAQAIGLLEPLDQPMWLGRAHLIRGVNLHGLHRFDDSMREIARGRVLLGGAGDAEGVASADAALATLNATRGRLDTASRQLARAIASFERLGRRDEVYNMGLALAQMHIELLQHDEALDLAERIWRSDDNAPNRRLYRVAGSIYARALVDTGRLDEAGRILAIVDVDDGPHDNQWLDVRSTAAELAIARGDFESAGRIAATVLGPATDLAEMPGAGAGPLFLAWTRSLRARGDSAALEQVFVRVSAWSAQLGADDPAAGIHAGLLRAERAWGERRLRESYDAYESALREATRVGVPRFIVEVADSWGNALIADGSLDKATEVVGQVASWADSDFRCALLTAALHRALGNRGAWEKALANARALAGQRAIPGAIATFSHAQAWR